MRPFRPMLAKPADFSILRFPLYASVKIDGLRCVIRNGVALSRSMEPLPNQYLQSWVAEHEMSLESLDGEIVVGRLNAPDVYRRSMSGIMSHDGEPKFNLHIFDSILSPRRYRERYGEIYRRVRDFGSPRVRVHHQQWIESMAELEDFEAEALEDGHEGIMTRDPDGYYKEGRATARSQELLKIKRYEDGEAVIIGCEEEMHNGNDAEVDAIGKTKRSSHKENLEGKGTLGALIVRGITAYKDVEFKIGTGFDAEERQDIWDSRGGIKGEIVKFKYFPVGAKDKPRHPVFLGFRDQRDMS